MENSERRGAGEDEHRGTSFPVNFRKMVWDKINGAEPVNEEIDNPLPDDLKPEMLVRPSKEEIQRWIDAVNAVEATREIGKAVAEYKNPAMGSSFDDYLKSEEDDPVSHPAHYTDHPSGIECIEITEHMNFNLGNATKYIWRSGLKNDAIEDLKKAREYLDDEIAKREQA